jgi:hypothetical protein
LVICWKGPIGVIRIGRGDQRWRGKIDVYLCLWTQIASGFGHFELWSSSIAARLAPSFSALRRALAAAEARADRAEAVQAIAKASDFAARNALLALQNEKMRRELYGQRSERGQRLIDQPALAFEDAEASAGEDERLAALAAAKTNVAPFVRKRRSRQPFPAYLPRERAVIPTPTCCPGCGCGSNRLSRVGENVTETLEVISRRWKVIQTVRKKGRTPELRDDQPATRAVSCHRARVGGAGVPGDAAVREVRPAPAAGSPARPLRA